MRSNDESVLAVLSSPAEMSSSAIAKGLGMGRETVRKIRIGETFPNLFPEFERLDAAQMRLSCENCVFFIRKSRYKSWCDFGYPEATSTKFARGCGAYLAREGEK